jgi:hypothetical protein
MFQIGFGGRFVLTRMAARVFNFAVPKMVCAAVIWASATKMAFILKPRVARMARIMFVQTSLGPDVMLPRMPGYLLVYGAQNGLD